MGLKTLRGEASGFKRVRSKQFDPLKTSSLSMMKKVISLLVLDRISVATSSSQCEVWQMLVFFFFFYDTILLPILFSIVTIMIWL